MISANTFQSNSFLDLWFSVSGSNTVAAKKVRAYINTSISLAGAVQVAYYNFANGRSGYAFCHRMAYFQDDANTFNIYPPATSLPTDYSVFGTTVLPDVLIDSTVGNYLIFSVELGDAADTCSLQSLLLTLI